MQLSGQRGSAALACTMQLCKPVLPLAAQVERGFVMVRMFTSFALALCATAALGAQAAPVGAKDGKAVTITGCLNSGQAGFVISNVLAARVPGEKGARGGAGTDNLLESYALVPGNGVALAPHVGHRVEIVGSVVEGGKKGEEAEPSRGRISRGPTAQFAVTSVKMISPVCIQ